jgi:hypothetical protein
LTGLEEQWWEFGIEQEARSDDWIDILLINRTNGTAIIVENKIHADDQDRQIPRYYDEIERRPFGKDGHNRVAAEHSVPARRRVAPQRGDAPGFSQLLTPEAK